MSGVGIVDGLVRARLVYSWVPPVSTVAFLAWWPQPQRNLARLQWLVNQPELLSGQSFEIWYVYSTPSLRWRSRGQCPLLGRTICPSGLVAQAALDGVGVRNSAVRSRAYAAEG